VILSLYGAPLSSDGWQQACDTLARFLDVEMIAAQGIDFDAFTNDLWGSRGIDMSAYAKVDPDWVRHDPYLPLMDRLEPVDSNAVASRHMPIEDFEDSLALREMFPAVDHYLNDMLCAGVTEGKQVIGGIMVYTEKRGEYHSDETVSRMEHLAPHIRKAILLTERFSELRDASDLQNHILDSQTYGFVVLDSAGRMTLHNRVADEMFIRGDYVRLNRSHLNAFWDEDDEALQRAIKDASIRNNGSNGDATPKATYIKLRSQSLGPELGVVISPMPGNEARTEYGCVNEISRVLICFSEREPILDARAKTIAKSFALTAQETSILVQLVGGQTARDISDRSGRSYETLRSQIKSIMNKVGASSQVELVRTVLSAPMIG